MLGDQLRAYALASARTLTPTGEVGDPRGTASGAGLHFISGCNGPPNGGDHKINLAKGPLWFVGYFCRRAKLYCTMFKAKIQRVDREARKEWPTIGVCRIETVYYSPKGRVRLLGLPLSSSCT